MKMRALVAAFAAVLALPGMGCAQSFSIVPPHPTSMDTIYVEKSFDNEDETRTRVTISGNRITVRPQGGIGFPEPPPGTISMRLGRLPEGTYEVELVSAYGGASLGVLPLTVGPRPAGIAADDFSDLWWSPDESGWGMNVMQHPTGMIFATLFAYAPDGTPAWYVIPGGSWQGPASFQGSIYRTTGPVLTAFDPSRVTVTPVGTATLAWGIGGMTAIFAIDGKTIVKKLQRQGF